MWKSGNVSSELHFLMSPEKVPNVLPSTFPLSSSMNEASSVNAGGRPRSDVSRVKSFAEVNGRSHEASRPS